MDAYLQVKEVLFKDFKQFAVQLTQRPEGIRVQHSLNANSIKMDDKQGRLLRIETTLHQTRDFRVCRQAQTGPHGRAKDSGKKAWRFLRKGVVDLKRRAESHTWPTSAI
jgi:hypothetical protein